MNVLVRYNNLLEREEERKRLSAVQKAFNNVVLEAYEGGASIAHLLRSPVEIQCELALDLLQTGKHPNGMITVLREIATLEQDDSKIAVLASTRLKALQRRIEETLSESNIIRLEPTSADSSHAECVADNEEKLSPFRDKVQAIVSSLVDDSLSTEPDQGKGRKKTVQNLHSKITDRHIEETAKVILNNAKENYENRSKHPPILIYGNDASGKSTLLTHLYYKTEELFSKPVLRIIRFSASTPRSAYNLELLRVMCQQISIILNIPEGYLPKDASFDPLYINNWFQSLLRRCEEMENEILLIFIDNVHRVNPLECDIVTGLSWLPMSLPRNVFLICTSAVALEQLQLTPAQKEKFRAQNCYYLLDSTEDIPDNDSCGEFIDSAFDNLEVVFGAKAFSKLAGYITCSEFGLTELELLELLMPTSNSDAVITLKDANFNFSSLCVAKYMMKSLLIENLVSGRCTWRWKAASASARARRRYVRVQSALRDAHSDLAALHFSGFLRDTDDADNSEAHEPGCVNDDDVALDSTPFHSASRTAAAFTQRHVEESWLHLLLAGDFTKLKDLTVCNFDFLLAAVQTVTISYLRCILEHVRCYILDRDVELVYGAVRKSSDILTRDPMQLGAQLAPSGQHLVLAPSSGDPQLWHVMSNSKVHTFKGHSGRILCMCVTRESQYLLTGSEDTSVIVWDLHTLAVKTKILEHIAPVLCVAAIVNRSLVISGGEDSAVIVTSLVTKLDHHRGPVTSVKVIQDGEIVVTGSQDGAVCSWNVDNFTLLNTVTAGVPIHLMDITEDNAEQSELIPISCLEVSRDGQLAASGCARGLVRVWQLSTHRLQATLGGHMGHITCVTFSPNNLIVLSGSEDRTVVVWQLADNSPSLTYKVQNSAEDKTLIIWETKRGLALTSLALHVPLLGFQITSDCARIVVHLLDRELRPLAPKRPMRRLLKKEVSLDTYTWQKKYAHLTSAAMMAQVDERLKRRFSVSASMEEISKIQEAKNKDLGSQ
ncbi:unnamed protein product, partial [Leptidea sinapis]